PSPSPLSLHDALPILLAGREELMPELADELRKLRLIAQVRPAQLKETAILRRSSAGRFDSEDESQGRERHGVQGDAAEPQHSGRSEEHTSELQSRGHL